MKNLKKSSSIKLICATAIILMTITVIAFNNDKQTSADEIKTGSEFVVEKDDKGKKKTDNDAEFKNNEKEGDEIRDRVSKPKVNNQKTSLIEEKPKKKKVWVVDKPAWTETIDDETKPIYEYVPTWWTYGNGTYKTHYSEKDAFDAYVNDTTGEHSSWGTGEYEKVLKGYKQKVIEHPEEEHWSCE